MGKCGSGREGVGGEGEGTRHPTPKCDNPPMQIGCDDDATRLEKDLFCLGYPVEP
jgi:hypothetical protein